jgi:hypothetical protein
VALEGLKEKILAIGLKPDGFRKYWGKEIERILQEYERVPKSQDSEVMLRGLIKTSLDAIVLSDPRIKFVPFFEAKILDGHIALKFREEDLRELEVHWLKFVR